MKARQGLSKSLSKAMRSIENIVLNGLPVSPGLASGKAFLFQDIFEREVRVYSIEPHQVDAEQARLQEAVVDVAGELKRAADLIESEIDSAVADIFRAHEMMLHDEEFLRDIRDEIERDLVNSERALQRVLRRLERKFGSKKDEMFRLRADDIVDLGRRLLRSLAGVRSHSLEGMPEGSVVVAKRLLPSETMFLSRRSAVALVVQFGGQGSHCAVLARAMGIPAVVQNSDLFHTVVPGDELLVDGLRGQVVVRPGPDTKRKFKGEIDHYHKELTRAVARAGEPATTLDGTQIPVMANIGCAEDVAKAIENGADGIGLYRIETFYLSRDELPKEEQLFDEFRSVIEPFKGKPVCLRLLDIGGDKPLPYLPLPPEPNPNLGRRGIRLLLDYPGVLRAQLRVILRLAQDHDLTVLVPMVSMVEEVKVVGEMLREAAGEIGVERVPGLGAMIETPAAALFSDEILQEAEFLSIGTNDLTQFIMGADRENPFVARYYLDSHACVMKAISSVCQRSGDRVVAVCGELAAETGNVESLLQAGVGMLSVAPPMLPLIKEAVRQSRASPSTNY